jgi:hypothetical protein
MFIRFRYLSACRTILDRRYVRCNETNGLRDPEAGCIACGQFGPERMFLGQSIYVLGPLNLDLL